MYTPLKGRGVAATFMCVTWLASQADGWSAPGHLVTAALAQRHLSSRAAAAVSRDLGSYSPFYPSENDFVTAAEWADTIKSSTHAFDSWHFVDNPYSPYVLAPSCPETPVNIVWALEEAAAVLRSSHSDPWSRSLMLRYLIHLVGDAHQPLHTASLFTAGFPSGDHGGNSVKLDPSVRVGHESATELHAFWDYGCGASGLERIHSEGSRVDMDAVLALAEELDDSEVAYIAGDLIQFTAEQSAAFKAWALESYGFARNTSYAEGLLDELGSGKEVRTSASFWGEYAADASLVARDRLRLGGARLAQAVNSLYDGSQAQQNEPTRTTGASWSMSAAAQ